MKHWTLDDRMTVVLFAGMGGACDGLERAGIPVNLAVNHEPISVAVHKKRHPHTKHLRCDVFEVCPLEATKGRRVRMLWASPDCTHFSIAKGAKPVSKRRRSLAWVVCRWAGQVRPDTIGLENVKEIQGWGPLIAKRDKATGRVLKLDGTVAAKGERVPIQNQQLVPDPKRKGKYWKAWIKHLRGLGYSFECHELICADFGVPTIRKRLFGIAKADGSKPVWPKRTHAPRHEHKALGLKAWVGAHSIIDWSLPSQSIFERKKPLAEATERRTAKGIMKYVVNDPRPFLVPITHTSNSNVHDTLEPLRTITTAKGGELTVAVPKFQPANCEKTDRVAAFLAQHNGGPRAPIGSRSAQDPVSTVTTTGAQQGLAAVSLTTLRGSTKDGRDVREPVPALMAGGNHVAAVAALVETYYSSGGNDHTVKAPLSSLTGRARHGVVTVDISGVTYQISDIHLRMLQPEEGAAAHGFLPGDLPDTIELDGKLKRLTKTQKYHLVGNSVPPDLPKILAELNVDMPMRMEAV
ncbi:DNA cytosine methyltransferase [Maritalea sp.]|uniref:DNA cytosine methyltransferase n=1 Tax=Maritalea sp. TaxID=2003361 RepID=UPI003EF0C3FF